jgi:hypothetical protein
MSKIITLSLYMAFNFESNPSVVVVVSSWPFHEVCAWRSIAVDFITHWCVVRRRQSTRPICAYVMRHLAITFNSIWRPTEYSFVSKPVHSIRHPATIQQYNMFNLEFTCFWYFALRLTLTWLPQSFTGAELWGQTSTDWRLEPAAGAVVRSKADFSVRQGKARAQGNERRTRQNVSESGWCYRVESVVVDGR